MIVAIKVFSAYRLHVSSPVRYERSDN